MRRVYVAVTPAELAGLVTERHLAGPLAAHAVTEGLRSAWPDGDDEQWEYAALMAAADDALTRRDPADPARRLVVAADVAEAIAGEGTAVTVPDLTWSQVAALLADPVELGALAEDPEAAAEVDLAWFATQEIAAFV
ncbi:hypothetical protein [Nocardioides sp.]|uniref:DUF6912 family protein n=1 Tax=Nocardioides sp. TaxID=35761 RepID=UPI00352737DA